MRTQKFLILVVIWAVSIILSVAIRPTWIVEGTMNHLNFEFPSKEAYVLTVQIVQWSYGLFFGVLPILTFTLLQRRTHLP